jgi:hypothetical protein
MSAPLVPREETPVVSLNLQRHLKDGPEDRVELNGCFVISDPLREKSREAATVSREGF